MRTIAALCCGVLLLACAKTEEAPRADSPAAAPAAPAAAATISLADLAGKWAQVVKSETTDSVLVTGEVIATADPSTWTVKLGDRAPMPLRVTADGDSIMTATGPYESVLRKGVQVTTAGVLRMVDGKLVGITTAHYQSAGADSVVRLRTEMTRAK